MVRKELGSGGDGGLRAGSRKRGGDKGAEEAIEAEEEEEEVGKVVEEES